MTKVDSRINDPDLLEWLKTKPNKSETTRQALKLLYKQEMQQDYDSQDKKIEVKVIG